MLDDLEAENEVEATVPELQATHVTGLERHGVRQPRRDGRHHVGGDVDPDDFRCSGFGHDRAAVAGPTPRVEDGVTGCGLRRPPVSGDVLDLDQPSLVTFGSKALGDAVLGCGEFVMHWREAICTDRWERRKRYDRTVPDVAFVASPAQDYFLRELAGTLGHELRRQGVAAASYLGRFPQARPDRVFVLMNPRQYVELAGTDALPNEAILKRTIFMCDEVPPTDEADAHLELLPQAGAVFALDRRHVISLHRLGVPARLLRPGYSDALDHFDPEAQRPIDVMVLGSHSPRRTRYLKQAAPILARHNCLIQLADPGPHPHDTASFLGAGRWPLLARTKVLLNLHRDEDNAALEWRAALDAIHAGAVVVSEHSTGIAPLEVGQHLLVASPEALPYVADALLRDQDRLAALRTQAYERLSTWIPYALPVSVLRAAIVELVGEPLPAGGAAGTPLAADAGRAIGPPTTPPGPPPTHASPREALARRRVTAIAVRAESPAWAARRAPRLTVVCALGEDQEISGATLDSVARSRLRDLELIAVHPDGAESAGAAAARWTSEHPRVAARVIAAMGSQTLATLRTVGAAMARSALCLILDAGQEVYPRALDVLVATLEATSDATFTYPIQDVVGAPEAFVAAGGDYLESYFGWDPGRRPGPGGPHSPLLIRTDSLRRLGFFAEHLDSAREADDDLLRRISDCGERGQLVPQVLARRRESASSPVRRG